MRRRAALFLGACAIAAQAGATEMWVRVKTDRVNLRARPELTAEVVAQVQTDERLAVVSMQPEWVEVVPPDSVDVWAFREFIVDGTVTVNRLNIRAGPGINYSIVGSIPNGQPVAVRGQFGEWVKVAPANATLWIHREFVEPLAPAAPPPAPVPMPPAMADGTLDPPPASAAMPSSIPPDLQLVPLEGQGRPVRVEGELKPAPFLFNRPSAFRLVRKEGVQLVTICYVRGNTAQLNSLLNEHLTIYGREIWVQGVRQPVVLLERIERRAR